MRQDRATTPASDFKTFAERIGRRFSEMSRGELFTVGASEGMFERYLACFPEGADPIFKTRTEHDCSMCKAFVRHLGRVVRLQDGKVETVWGVEGLPWPYAEVAAAMHEFVRSLPIVSVFRTKEAGYGNETTRQLLESGTVVRWNHLCGKVERRHQTASPDEAKGEHAAAVGVFRRGLEELRPDALAQILELIDGNALYRGTEHRKAVRGFIDLQGTYRGLAEAQRDAFVWAEAGHPAARLRNAVIGTLAQDLSEGVELETAVRSFETKVAPTNYRRTTALITPRMVEDAMKTIDELGLEPALHRRLANLSDVSVNNVLWVDRAVRPQMKGGIEGLLMSHAVTTAPAEGSALEVGIDYFMAEVLSAAQSIDLHLRNAHLANFVTLTAPASDDAPRLFRWPNGFAWSYDGNVTDSIRERVKAAGGNVDAKLRFSLAWSNHDDLDLHVVEPDGNHIYYHNKCGKLDVDMNAGRGTTRQPVENVSFVAPMDGAYQVYVNQYAKRETADVGFSIEVATAGGVSQLSYAKGLQNRQDVPVGTFAVKGGAVVEAKYGPGIVGVGIPQSKWGLRTEGTVKVQTVLLSPNFWDDVAVGNKHTFFILEGCRTDEPARGLYNEFLRPDLERHRKVFEVLGDKTKCPPTDRQLSGLGFSSTRGDKVTITVRTDRGSRLYNVFF